MKLSIVNSEKLALLSSQMFNASPTFVSKISQIFSEIDCRKLLKSLSILMDKKCGDPRLLAVHSRSGLVFGIMNFLSNQEESENIPDDLLYSVNRLSEAILLVLSNLPENNQIKSETSEISSKEEEKELQNGQNGFDYSSDNLEVPPEIRSENQQKLSEKLIFETLSPKFLINNAVPNGIEEVNRVQLPFNKIYESLILSQARLNPVFFFE